MGKYRTWFMIVVLLVSFGLLAACSDNEGDDEFGTNEGFGNEAFGNEEFGLDDDAFSDVDATPLADQEPLLDATPVAPELLPTGTVTVEMATAEPAATPTAMPEMTATVAVDATATVTRTGETARPQGAVFTETHLVRATDLLGMRLVVEGDAESAVLRDFLFSEDGTIHYAIFSMDVAATDLVAVPWDQVQLQVPATTAIRAQDAGFIWADRVGIPQTWPLAADFLDDDSVFLDDDLDIGDLDDDLDDDGLISASALIDGPLAGEVITIDNEALGTVRDLLVDVDAGRVVYVVVEADSSLFASARLVAIPWQRLRYDADAAAFGGDFDQELLESSPDVDFDVAFVDDDIRMDRDLMDELNLYWDVDLDWDRGS